MGEGKTGSLLSTILASKVGLKPTLGLFNAVSVIIGVIIGSGIFISPKGVLIHGGSVGISLIVWCTSGAVALVGGLCYMELGGLMPSSGGDYHYIERSYGSFLSFLYVWTQVSVIFPASNACISITFAKYFLQPIYPSCDPPQGLDLILASFAILVLSAVNCFSVKLASRIQDAFSVAKVAALLVIIGFGIAAMASRRSNFPSSIDEAFAESKTSPADISLAFYQGLYTYAGFNFLNFLMGEIQNPTRNLPAAIFIAMPLITFVYVMTNVSYFVVLSLYEMRESEATALSFADRTMGKASWVMSLFVSLSCFGGLNACILSSSRIFFVAAQKGHLPDVLSLIHVTQSTPVPAVLLECALSVAMLFAGNVYQLINYLTFAEYVFLALAVSVVPYLRWKKPHLPRPIRVPLFLVIAFLLVCGFLIVIPIIQDPYANGWGLLIISIGIPIYWFGVLWKPEDKPAPVKEAMVTLTHTTQKLFLCAKEDD